MPFTYIKSLTQKKWPKIISGLLCSKTYLLKGWFWVSEKYLTPQLGKNHLGLRKILKLICLKKLFYISEKNSKPYQKRDHLSPKMLNYLSKHYTFRHWGQVTIFFFLGDILPKSWTSIHNYNWKIKTCQVILNFFHLLFQFTIKISILHKCV